LNEIQSTHGDNDSMHEERSTNQLINSDVRCDSKLITLNKLIDQYNAT
jgi:hypothetical protein